MRCSRDWCLGLSSAPFLQNLCCLVLGRVFACSFCICAGRRRACTKPQEAFPEKSFIEGRTEEGKTDLRGTTQMRSILFFFFFILDVLPKNPSLLGWPSEKQIQVKLGEKSGEKE